MTSFVLTNGQYEFKVLPFILVNASRIFQRIIHKILENASNIRIYLDDILICTNKDQNHLDKLEEVLKRPIQAGLAINWKKSQVFQQKVKYNNIHKIWDTCK